jgi:hypothetical protein
MNRARTFLLATIAAGSCKIADPDHCFSKGEHVWCAANQADLPFCSPCARVEDHAGCVADPPTEAACPEFNPPETTSGSSGTGTSTGATDANSSESSSG